MVSVSAAEADAADVDAVTRVATEYFQAWLAGDGERIRACLHPALAKRAPEQPGSASLLVHEDPTYRLVIDSACGEGTEFEPQQTAVHDGRDLRERVNIRQWQWRLHRGPAPGAPEDRNDFDRPGSRGRDDADRRVRLRSPLPHLHHVTPLQPTCRTSATQASSAASGSGGGWASSHPSKANRSSLTADHNGPAYRHSSDYRQHDGPRGRPCPKRCGLHAAEAEHRQATLPS